MDSLVIELQQQALNPNVEITDLLRKALFLSKKLGIKDFQQWTENELNGYQNTQDIPSYRKIRGHAQVCEPFRGWESIIFKNSEDEDYWSNWKCCEPISQLSALNSQSKKDQELSVSYKAESANTLKKGVGTSYDVRCMVAISSIAPIFDSIRNIILNWSIKLEQDGILGEGLTFTSKEKEIAGASTYNVTNFFGEINSSQIQQNTSSSNQHLQVDTVDIENIKRVINEIKEKISMLALSREIEEELKSDILTIEAQTKSPKPKKPVLREGISSVRRILEGAGGTIAAQLLLLLTNINL